VRWRRRTGLALTLVLVGVGTVRDAWPAEPAGCPVLAITGSGPARSSRPDRAQLEEIAKGLTADVRRFHLVLDEDLDLEFREGGPEVDQEGLRACVDAIVADSGARTVLLAGMREGVITWARARADAASSDHAKDPEVPALRSIDAGCVALGFSGTDDSLGDLYRTLASEILAEKPGRGETEATGRPAGPRLWPVTLFRDALVQAYANQPDLASALSTPPAPAALRQGDAVQVPLPADTPAYREYLAWLEPAAWPSSHPDTPANPLLGAALACLAHGGVFSALRSPIGL
jgi:hypothetical protein